MTSRLRTVLALLGLVVAACGSGSPPAVEAPVGAATPPASTWPTYHGNAGRTGDAGASLPVLTGTLRAAWNARLDGAVYAEPVLVGSTVVVATENDSVYALSLAGRVLWRRHLGTPVPLRALPCGNIDPLGITGTPAYDRATGSLFVVAETTGGVHTLYALAATTGAIRWHRNLDVQTKRQRIAQQQRGALLVTAGRVVVAFGGLYGDCGNYVGYVTSVPTSGQGATTTYTVPTAREAGIWAPPGPVLGPNGLVYVATGNGAATGGTWDGSDSVVSLVPSTMRRVSAFAPRTWPQDNAQDLDLGSLSPVPVSGGHLVAAGKRGTVYLLHWTLGGVGRQIAALNGCQAYGGAAVRSATVYLPCVDGLRALRYGTSSLRWTWQASGIPGSPVLAGGVAYVLAPSRSTFYELSLSTGRVLRSLRVPAVSRFATPTVANGGRLVLVPTMTGVVAVV
jgi:outer membrane protein assembly factor BamB